MPSTIVVQHNQVSSIIKTRLEYLFAHLFEQSTSVYLPDCDNIQAAIIIALAGTAAILSLLIIMMALINRREYQEQGTEERISYRQTKMMPEAALEIETVSLDRVQFGTPLREARGERYG